MPRKKSQISSPHDRYIRAMMGKYPQVALEFFEANLPQKIREAIDFTSIQLQKESYIDDGLRLQIADLLYAVNFNGKPGYLYLLLEHASKPDPLLPFRMLKYMVAIMDDHLKKREGKGLPIIYPFVLYTGEKAFNHSMDLFDLFGEQKALAKDILANPFHLMDLTQASDEELEQYLWFGTAALAMKHIHDNDIIPFLEGFLKLLNMIEKMGETDYIEIVLSYIVKAGQASDKDKFVKVLKTGLESTSEEKIMRIVDHFKLEGRQEAWVEFNQLKPELFDKVKRETKDETLHDVALNFLKLQVGVDKISEATGLPIKEIESLQMQIN